MEKKRPRAGELTGSEFPKELTLRTAPALGARVESRRWSRRRVLPQRERIYLHRWRQFNPWAPPIRRFFFGATVTTCAAPSEVSSVAGGCLASNRGPLLLAENGWMQL